MPEWTRHLLFALTMALVVVVGAVLLVHWGMRPLADSGAAFESPLAALVLAMFGMIA